MISPQSIDRYADTLPRSVRETVLEGTRVPTIWRREALARDYGNADPLRKLAVMGLSGFQRAWLRLTRRVAWPENTAFFKEYERAKEWLVSEGG